MFLGNIFCNLPGQCRAMLDAAGIFLHIFENRTHMFFTQFGFFFGSVSANFHIL